MYLTLASTTLDTSEQISSSNKSVNKRFLTYDDQVVTDISYTNTTEQGVV